MNKIIVGKSPVHGKGIFATQQLGIQDVVEECNMIILPKSDEEYIQCTELNNYYFEWGDNKIAIALGNGSLYNHSPNPNAQFVRDMKRGLLVVSTIKPITKGEEIFVNYLTDGKAGEQVWFEQYVPQSMQPK